MRLLRESKVVTYTRHSASCPEKSAGELCETCDCPKWHRWSYGGKQFREPAGTRTWSIAKGAAKEMQKRLNNPSTPDSQPAQALTIAALAESYMLRKQSEGVGQATEVKVRYQIGLFEQFLAARGKFYPADITAPDIVAFKATWSSWRSSVTRAKAQTNIRGFLKSFVRGERRDELLEAFGKVKETRQDTERLEPKPFTEDEIKRLMVQVPITFPDPTKAAKITAMIHLQLSSGMSARDTVQLEIASIKDGNLAIKRQKSSRPAGLRLDDSLYAELLAIKNSNPRYVFWNGNSLPQSATKDYIRHIQDLMKDSGVYISGNVSHRFRDSFVDTSRADGWSMEEIASALGVTVTILERHYSSLTSKRMKERIAKLPVRSWKRSA